MENYEGRISRLEERTIKIESNTEQNTKDISEMKRDMTSFNKEQVKTTIEMTEIKGDIKAILSSVNVLNDNWKDFDKTQRDNANKIRLQILGVIITSIAGIVFTYFKMK
jgi:predicted  nucleic acid-binding Zn-ribbon protein